MAHHQHHQHEAYPNPAGLVALSSHNGRPQDSLHILDEEAILDVDEPPDSHISFKRQPIRSPTLSLITNPLDGVMDQNKQKSLLTQGLSSESKSATPRPRSIISSISTDSVASVAELTSDGGLTSPARTSTPSPPLPATTIAFNGRPMLPLRKTDAVVLAPAPEAPRKRCITFACANPPKLAELKQDKPAEAAVEAKKPCTIKFACPAKPKEPTQEPPVKPVPQPVAAPTVKEEPTPKKLTPKASFSKSPNLTKKKRVSEALRFHEFASKRLEDDEWVHEQSRRPSKLTLTDTLRKEAEFRKLGEEAAAEAREAELEEDEEAMNAEDEDVEDDEDLDEDLDDDEDEDNDDEEEVDEESDVDSDGNESDNEAGFADSDDDDETEPNSDYQFWTTGLTTAATSTDHLEHIGLRQRTESTSSIDSVISSRTQQTERGPRSPEMKKHRKQPKQPVMRPGTPELPDSTDFVCGTLDEDRPLEAAYISCIKQRKLAKRGIIPQDLDPTFPTSDLERSDEEDNAATLNSNDDAWAAGHFDDFDMNTNRRGRRGTKSKTATRSPSISPKRKKSPAPVKRSKSPAPKRSKSPCPQVTRTRAMAHTPPPARRLFGQSPKRHRSPTGRHHPASPQTSRRPSYEDRSMNVPLLAQRPNMTITKSLPRTPNPFWQEHRRQQKAVGALTEDSNPELHSRGPIDIVQGLEKKRQRRKDKFWLTHCRKDAKEKEKDRRKQLHGRGAKRMRELGLEAADRCKGYGPRVQVILSI